MVLGRSEKAAMIASTHEAACNLRDDLSYIRSTIAKLEIESADLRRMSAVLRRLLIDNQGDLRKVAPPRLGKRVEIVAYDSREFLKESLGRSIALCTLGVSGLFGIPQESIAIFQNNSPVENPNIKIRGFRGAPTPPILLSLDKFMSQNVLCFNGIWARRIDVIKFVANVAGGVHSGKNIEPIDFILDEARKHAVFRLEDGQPKIEFSVDLFPGNTIRGVDFRRRGVDFVLLQLMVAARYLTISPDIHALEKTINSEVENNGDRSV